MEKWKSRHMKAKKRYQPSEEDSDSMNEETCIVVPKSKSGKGKGPKCTKTDGQQIGYRICKAGPKSVQNCDYKKKMEQIETKTCEEKSPSPWTDTFYQEFLKKNACCTLAFKYQNVKTTDSRKKKSPFFRATAHCTFDGCKAVYSFSKKKAGQNQLIKQYVLK